MQCLLNWWWGWSKGWNEFCQLEHSFTVFITAISWEGKFYICAAQSKAKGAFKVVQLCCWKDAVVYTKTLRLSWRQIAVWRQLHTPGASLRLTTEKLTPRDDPSFPSSCNCWLCSLSGELTPGLSSTTSQYLPTLDFLLSHLSCYVSCCLVPSNSWLHIV